VTPAIAELAWAAWDQLSGYMEGGLAVPNASPGPDGQLLFSWEREPQYLELELFPDRPGEFCYRNDHTGALWEREWRVGEPIAAESAARLALFA
jgi:hypothetical protein